MCATGEGDETEFVHYITYYNKASWEPAIYSEYSLVSFFPVMMQPENQSLQ